MTAAPSGPVVGWQDARGRPWDRALTERLGKEWFERHLGHSKSDSAIGELLRLREQGTLREGFQVGWVGDIVVGRLCGRRAHDGTSLSEASLYNPQERREDGELLQILGIGTGDLPALLTVDQAAGGLRPEIALALGLPPGIPVGPAVHDQYAAATGCGVVRPGDTMFGAGTAWVLVAVSANLEAPVTPGAIACAHPVPGMYGQMLSLVNGGACISWAVRTLNLGPLGVSETDALIASAPPGSAGLRFRPLLSEGGGAGFPRGLAGRLDGLRLEHTPAHILRATVEGLACELGRYLQMMAAGGVNVGRLVMCGKAAASTVTPGIIADTTGVPVDCVAIPETSSLGAAVLARGLVEPKPGLACLADEMKPAVRRVEPEPAPLPRGRCCTSTSAHKTGMTSRTGPAREPEEEEMGKIRIGLLPLYLKLYDDLDKGTRRPKVEEFPRTIAAELARRGLDVVSAPVCRIEKEFAAAVKKLEAEKVDALVTLHLAYSPSLESSEVLARTHLPLIVLDTTPTWSYAPDQDPDELMYNHGIHGVQDMCNLLLRNGKPFLIEAGHWQRSDVLDRVAALAVPARMAAAMRRGKAGILGTAFKGMGDFYVPAGEDQGDPRRHREVAGPRDPPEADGVREAEGRRRGARRRRARFDEGRGQRRGARAVGQAGARHSTLGGEGGADGAHLQLPQHGEEGRVRHGAVPGDEQGHGARHRLRGRG